MSKSTDNGNCKVTFVYEPPETVEKVFVAGDFNNWDPASMRMTRRNGTFRKRVELDPGEHTYKYVVDGEWQPDPRADVQVADGHGGVNSQIVI